MKRCVERAGMKMEFRVVSESIEKVGHMEIMDENRLARKVLTAKVSGGRVRDRPR